MKIVCVRVGVANFSLDQLWAPKFGRLVGVKVGVAYSRD